MTEATESRLKLDAPPFCPLLTIAFGRLTKCEGEKCAWWVKEPEHIYECSITALVKENT